MAKLFIQADAADAGEKMQFLTLLKTTAIACLVAGSVATAVGGNGVGSGPYTIFLTIGLNPSYNGWVQYAPYDGAHDFDVSPVAGLEMRFLERNIISAEYNGMVGGRAMLPRHLTVIESHKGAFTYLYEPVKFVYLGPHGIVGSGVNKYAPNKMIDGTYYGTLSDEYYFWGAGLTVMVEPYRRFHIKAYASRMEEYEHNRTNTVDGELVGTAQSLKMAKATQYTIGFIVQYSLYGG